MEVVEPVLLRLYVTGNSQRSLRAVEAVKSICQDLLSSDVQMEVVDVLNQPEIAESEKILATPTLVRQSPGPPRRLVGDLGKPMRVIELLGLQQYTRRPPYH